MNRETPIQFQEIFEGSTEGIVIVNKTGTIVEANPSSERIFNYNTGELIGKSLDCLLPDRLRVKHKQFREDFHNAPSPRSMGMGRDLMALRKDGSEFPVEVSLSYTESNGQFLVMAFVIDITQRKKAENALKQSEEQLIVYATELERKVEARTEALNELVHKLENEVQERKKAEEEVRKSLERERELNDLKSKFVSIASHEFRTPLSTILSSTSLIQQYKERNEFDKQDKHINRIKSSVNHLTGILNDFLSLGKLEEGKLEVLRETFTLKDFLYEVLDEVRPSLKDEQSLVIDMLKDYKVDTDPRMLRNILFNLLSNASKYSDKGKKITLKCTCGNEKLILMVMDEGIGIPDTELKYLFDRFFRASNVTNIQGTGLGLHIVKRYVDLLKGTISFTSEEGKGSIFTIEIPIT
ncbi:PAS domain S-box protein [Chryseotalea sanaruensis]|uniref:histidine kinase n=1 Tax=Chryseotalea sanaruensis TaxID=2482724 RepID=A0A401UF28_9BACT|nr:PAS domain-containing sensor histidine kinase [Chryseotalea sanaruensis]GCC53477.1 PAS domain S-box protein [Chryseotalea sanaruensis]